MNSNLRKSYSNALKRTIFAVSLGFLHEKAMQRALIQYRKAENYDLVREALLKTGRQDLIGYDRDHCLIPPRKPFTGSNKTRYRKGK